MTIIPTACNGLVTKVQWVFLFAGCSIQQSVRVENSLGLSGVHVSLPAMTMCLVVFCCAYLSITGHQLSQGRHAVLNEGGSGIHVGNHQAKSRSRQFHSGTCSGG